MIYRGYDLTQNPTGEWFAANDAGEKLGPFKSDEDAMNGVDARRREDSKNNAA